jgi:hypothetical protein
VFRLEPIAASCTFRNGSGVNPPDYACVTAPVLGASWTTTVATNPATSATVVMFALLPDAGLPFLGGEVLIDFALPPMVVPGGGGMHSVPIPDDVRLLGAKFSSQGLRVESWPGGPGPVLVLLNALDLELGV